MPSLQQQHHYKPWGHDIQSSKPPNTTRLYYKNTNGIGTRAFTNGLTMLYQHHKDMGTDIALYTETNTNWQQPTTRQLNETHCRQIHRNATFAYSSRVTSSPQSYQAGGTMVVLAGMMAARHLETGTDPTGMGRFSSHKITGANSHKIIFIAAYQVCKETISTAGENTSFFHQWHELTKKGYRHPNPRRQILDDLKTIILRAIGEGTDVCMAMDSNEAFNSKNQHFQEWIAECSLLSVHENMYDEEYYEVNKIPTTHQNGTSKIDHVFCTPRLFGSVTRAAIEPLHDGIFSDHRALVVDFNTAQLIGQAVHITKPKTRLLVSTRKKSMHQYQVELDRRLQAQNIYTRMGKLLEKYQSATATTIWMEQQVETIDQYITDCMLNAEVTIHEHNLDNFSPHKVEMAMMEKIWKLTGATTPYQLSRWKK
jgi:hypothetical protein